MSHPILEFAVGDLKVHVLSDGFFSLDGGAMFGVVPKVLWEKKLPADDKNRVRLATNCLLVTLPDGTRVLADTGMGDRWSEKERSLYAIDRETTLAASLARVGVALADIDLVVNSHLHFDHAGGNCVANAEGRIVPTFPGAYYIEQDREWEEANNPHERHRASYRRDDFQPLVEAGQLRLVRGTSEVAPGVFVEHCPGHCPGHQILRLESKGEGLVYPGDLMPTAAHVRPTWNMGYDLDVVATVNGKRALLERVLANDWTICFDHEPVTPLVKVRREVNAKDGREDFVLRSVGEALS